MTHETSGVTPRREHLGSPGGGNLWRTGPLTMKNASCTVEFCSLSPQRRDTIVRPEPFGCG